MSVNLMDENYEAVKSFSSYKSILDMIKSMGETKYRRGCTTIVKEKLTNKPELIDLCIILKVYLNYYFLNRNSIIQSSNHCEYINYLLNDKLKDINYLDYRSSKFYHTLNEWDGGIYLWDICDKKFYDINEYVLKKMKILHLLHEYFNKLKVTRGISVNDENYCSSVKKCVKLYNDTIGVCSLNNDTKFCREMQEFKNEYDRYTTTKNMCTEKTILQTPQEAYNVSRTGSYGYIFVTEEDIGMLYMEGINPPSEKEINNFPASVISGVCTTIAIFPIIYMLHKFTPLGLWTQPLIRRGEKTWNNMEQEKNEFLLSYEKSNLNLDINEY
ncbi:PIR Superfamily Protein [Plasmodium ovale wallikeri]|uniref:PIR Superfamily Protein n=1 Tax=Plasmodium ovale wallikeri TaxID=864142 RepID=A0A1A8YYV8_PLAOA|nr:PIR Superfamily Protein [Plasmodium ovale wallikeri]SBT57237.1 PIR Superfamily Protein [Plasmodium ovale wallikeri]